MEECTSHNNKRKEPTTTSQLAALEDLIREDYFLSSSSSVGSGSTTSRSSTTNRTPVTSNTSDVLENGAAIDTAEEHKSEVGEDSLTRKSNGMSVDSSRKGRGSKILYKKNNMTSCWASTGKNDKVSSILLELHRLVRGGKEVALEILAMAKEQIEEGGGDFISSKKSAAGDTIDEGISSTGEQNKVFALRRGRSVKGGCIFLEKQDLLQQIEGFDDSEYKEFGSLDLAYRYLAEDSEFDRHYNKLVDFYNLYGTSDVPVHTELGQFATRLRAGHEGFIKGGPSPLTKKQVEKLKEIDFYFSGKFDKRSFSQWVGEVERYRKRNGGHDPPQNTLLYRWIKASKTKYLNFKKGGKKKIHYGMDAWRCEELEKVGFDWTRKGGGRLDSIAFNAPNNKRKHHNTSTSSELGDQESSGSLNASPSDLAGEGDNKAENLPHRINSSARSTTGTGEAVSGVLGSNGAAVIVAEVTQNMTATSMTATSEGNSQERGTSAQEGESTKHIIVPTNKQEEDISEKCHGPTISTTVVATGATGFIKADTTPQHQGSSKDPPIPPEMTRSPATCIIPDDAGPRTGGAVTNHAFFAAWPPVSANLSHTKKNPSSLYPGVNSNNTKFIYHPFDSLHPKFSNTPLVVEQHTYTPATSDITGTNILPAANFNQWLHFAPQNNIYNPAMIAAPIAPNYLSTIHSTSTSNVVDLDQKITPVHQNARHSGAITSIPPPSLLIAQRKSDDFSTATTTTNTVTHASVVTTSKKALTTEWDEMLVLFKATYPNGNKATAISPDVNKKSDTPALDKWLIAQQDAYTDYWVNRGKKRGSQNTKSIPCSLTDEQVCQLFAAGVDLKEPDLVSPKRRKKRSLNLVSNTTWDKMLQEIRDFKETTGHTMPPHKTHKILRQWVRDVQVEYKRFTNAGDEEPSVLTKEKIDSLKKINFKFEGLNQPWTPAWLAKFEELKRYKAQNGHCNVPRNFDEPDMVGLGGWVKEQRKYYQKMVKGQQSYMTPEKAEMLSSIGFTWVCKIRQDVGQVKGRERKSWDLRFEELLEFKRQHGHTRVPGNLSGLGSWVTSQREHYKRMKQNKRCPMSSEQATRLEQIGFEFVVGKKKLKNCLQTGGTEGDPGK